MDLTFGTISRMSETGVTPDAVMGARTAIRVAIVAAVVSGISAVLSFVGIWYGATQETDRSRAEFLRDQRIVLYSNVIKHTQLVEDVETDLSMQLLLKSRDVDPADFSERLKAVEKDLEIVTQDEYSMRLLASEEAVSLFAKARSGYLGFVSETEQAVVDDCLKFSQRDTPKCQVSINKALESGTQGRNAFNDLLAQFRKDMGAE